MTHSPTPSPENKPAWVDRFVWTVLWKAVAVGAAVAVLAVAATRAQDLLRMLIISVFFSLALIPAVNYIHTKWGWRRGGAVGFVYAAGFAFIVLMVAVLIPAIIEFADQVQSRGEDWAAELNSFTEDTFGTTVVQSDDAATAAQVSDEVLEEWAGELLGFASSGVALIFNMATIAMFTFYLTADYPRFERALMSRMPPQRQRTYGWISDTSIEQTGGYFYSRLVLAFINGALAFVVMLLVGLPAVFALPLAVFMGFVSTFIPAVGTYIGAAIPILIVLAVQGLTPALILLAWVLVYQQIENMLLSPRISANTMELNGAVAFGAALAGGAIAGPIGAFMSLPVAALITAVVKNSGSRYDVVYQIKYADERPSTSHSPHADTAGAAAPTASGPGLPGPSTTRAEPQAGQPAQGS